MRSQPIHHDQMRRVLSLACGYYPPKMKGGPEMRRVIDMVVEYPLPGLSLHQVLIMAQDLKAKELVEHLIKRMWCKHQDRH